MSNRLTIRSSLNFSIWFYFRYKLTFSKETLKNSAVKFDYFPYNELHVNLNFFNIFHGTCNYTQSVDSLTDPTKMILY